MITHFWRRLTDGLLLLLAALPGRDKTGEQALFFKQFVIGPLFGDPAVFKNQNAVAILEGGKPVRDDEGRLGAAADAKGLLHMALAEVVQRAGGLVQDQDRRVL